MKERDKFGRYIKGKIYTKRCLICNVIFSTTRIKTFKTSKYCSRECYFKNRVGKTTSLKGRIGLSSTKFKKGETSGKNNSNWKGGITPINKAIRNSLEYEAWRTKVFERDLYTCQECGQVGGYLHADHIKPFALYPDLRFELTNGRTLCINCHRQTDTWGGRVWQIQE